MNSSINDHCANNFSPLRENNTTSFSLIKLQKKKSPTLLPVCNSSPSRCLIQTAYFQHANIIIHNQNLFVFLFLYFCLLQRIFFFFFDNSLSNFKSWCFLDLRAGTHISTSCWVGYCSIGSTSTSYAMSRQPIPALRALKTIPHTMLVP